jgi:RNA 2',3'-cyclic 3'-phosphodiesterase
VSVFLAIDLDGPTRERVAELIQLWSGRLTATWLTPEKLHLTVAFFGELSALERTKAIETIEPIARGESPFQLECLGAGVFETRRAPMVLWLGVGGQVAEAAQLRTRCLNVLKMADDRPWVPHVTVARVHTPTPMAAAALAEFERVRGLKFGVTHLTLYESYEGTYTALARFPFKAPASSEVGR